MRTQLFFPGYYLLYMYIIREAGNSEAEVEVTQTVQDELRRINTIRMSSKIRSFDMFLEQSNLKVGIIY